MRKIGLNLAWIVLLVTMAGVAIYAELTYEPPALDGAAKAASDNPGDAGMAEPEPVTAASPPPMPPSTSSSQPPPRREPSALTAAAVPPRVAFAGQAPADDGMPRIAVILTEIGLARARSRHAIDTLPAGITMAVMAYADNVSNWLKDARIAGHETLLAMPMEPIDYPRFDPGPSPLLTELDDLENLDRFDKGIGRTSGYVGVLAHMGSRFLSDPARLRPILAATQDRGLIFVDSRSGPDSAVGELASPLELHAAFNDRFIDEPPTREKIDARLGELEAIAKRRGFAVGIATPYPVTIKHVRDWANGLAARGIMLVPVSAVAGVPAG
jgi:polysaccharide deacetylase 2 family uncharacterized protein YibQ